jgi:predicted polyphosphate/ATP-dependent NAD kinase
VISPLADHRGGMSGTVGIIANPAAGKDIRRLVAHASPTSDAAKIGVVRRAVLGAIDAGATRIVVAPDRHNLSTRAIEGLSFDANVTIEVIDEETYGIRADTTAMAMGMAKRNVDALIVLGGDGTHRDVAKGWLDAPIVAVSTGTNNVFPRSVDATLAGVAAGLVASGRVPFTDVAFRAKVLHVQMGDGSPDDLALVDLALTSGQFIGSRAVWDPMTLRAVVACIAEPASVGLSAVAGLLHPLDRRIPGAVCVLMDGPDAAVGSVRAPLAPGLFFDVGYTSVALVDDCTVLRGPGVLSFDGERDRLLAEGATAMVCVRTDGPWVIDVDQCVRVAAQSHVFERPQLERT